MKAKQGTSITKLLEYYSSPSQLAKYSDAKQLKAELEQLSKVLQFASSGFSQRTKHLKREADQYTNQVQQTVFFMDNFVNNVIPTYYMKRANQQLAFDVLAKTTRERHNLHMDSQEYTLQFQMKLKFLESQGVNTKLWGQYFDKTDRNLKIRDQKYCIFMCLLFKDKKYSWNIKKVQSNYKKHDYLSYFFVQIFLPEFQEIIKNENRLIELLIKSLHFCQCLNLQMKFQEFVYNNKIYRPKQKMKLAIEQITYQIIFPDIFKDHRPVIKIREVPLTQLNQSSKQEVQIEKAQKMEQKGQKGQNGQQIQNDDEFLKIYISPNGNRCQLYIQQKFLSCQSMGHIDGFTLYQFIKTIHIERQKLIKLRQRLNLKKQDLKFIMPLIRVRGKYLRDSKISSEKSQDIERQAQQNGLYILANIQPDNQTSQNSASKSLGETPAQQSPTQNISPLNHSSSQIESTTFNLSVPSYLVMHIDDQLNLSTQGLQPGLINSLWQKYTIDELFYHIDLRKKIAKIPYSQPRNQNQHFQIPFGLFKIQISKTRQDQQKVETRYLFRQHRHCFLDGRTINRRRQAQINNDDFIIGIIISNKFKDIKFKYWKFIDPSKFDTVTIYFFQKWKKYLQGKNQSEVLNVRQVTDLIQYVMFHFMTERYFVRKVNQRDKNALKIKLH